MTLKAFSFSESRIIIAFGLFSAAAVIVMGRLVEINLDKEFYLSYDMSAPRTVEIVRSYGDITDCSGIPLVNREKYYIAIINPDTVDRDAVEPHICNHEKYDSCIDGRALFLCEVDCSELPTVEVISVSKRYSDESICTHIIGYTDSNGGVCGLEKAYSDILGQPGESVTLSYSTDAYGDMLEGSGLEMKWESSYYTGISLTIDYEIQRICEAAMADVEKGAVIVMDVDSGGIRAAVSKPTYNPDSPADSLNDENSPFINRAFSAYSVGSVFKLVTAGAALEYGISDEYACDCTGSIHIGGDDFSCHRFGGHGEVDMRLAMAESCNPYFISLGQDIPTEYFHSFAEQLGFGEAVYFAEGISSAAGNLPTAEELSVPEEKANFSFGQGKLTATPLQVTRLTAAIANGGRMAEPMLIQGVTDKVRDYEVCAAELEPTLTRVMKRSTALKLKSFMITTMYKENSMGIPENVTAGGKTSTAQTWQYDENGNERLNCWFTGFFPADKPQYAVTVVIEDGISGNVTCGPIFAQIADGIAELIELS